MSDATVRPATHDDAAAVLPLARSLATAFDLDAGLFETMFHDVVSRRDASHQVATIEEQIVGYVLVALATRRAGPFYTALAYEDSATYFRKVLVRTPGRDSSSS